MSAEFREGRPSAAPLRKEYEKILGEDIEWQTADAVREEFDDDETELRLMEEEGWDEQEAQDMEELHSMEEPWAADDGFTNTTLDDNNTEGHGTTLSWLQRSREHKPNTHTTNKYPQQLNTIHATPKIQNHHLSQYPLR